MIAVHRITRVLIALLVVAPLILARTPGAEDTKQSGVPAAASTMPCAPTLALYDGARGGTPDTQGLLYQAFGFAITQTFSDGVTIFDTTAQAGNRGGYTADPARIPVLDRTIGYTLTFGVQIISEAHTSDDRAGFSIIALGHDLKGIELGFWSDHIWAQEGGSGDPLFTHDEDAAFATASGIVSYTLAIRGDTYALAANGTPILSGPLRDYTAFEGFPDVYETPDFIFLGDNTSSARARIALAAVSLTTGVCTLYLPLVQVSG